MFSKRHLSQHRRRRSESFALRRYKPDLFDSKAPAVVPLHGTFFAVAVGDLWTQRCAREKLHAMHVLGVNCINVGKGVSGSASSAFVV